MRGWFKPGRADGEGGRLSYDTPLDALRYVVLDTELTSLDHRTNRLLSVGALAMQGPSILPGDQFYRIVNPEVSIPAETVVIHKLRSKMCRAASRSRRP
jgi:DNA polymerase-3 subunit epsilon